MNYAHVINVVKTSKYAARIVVVRNVQYDVLCHWSVQEVLTYFQCSVVIESCSSNFLVGITQCPPDLLTICFYDLPNKLEKIQKLYRL